jgi:hypothetical protein
LNDPLDYVSINDEIWIVRDILTISLSNFVLDRYNLDEKVYQFLKIMSAVEALTN